jgi:hypothetical protein
LALNFEHVHRQSFGECIARSAVLDFEGANEREGLRRDAQMRLRPEIEGLRSDLSIRQHRQPPVAPSDPISVARTNWVAGGWAAAMSRNIPSGWGVE